MKCRVCGEESAELVENVAFYADFSKEVYDCSSCGCRFTDCDPEAYDALHSNDSHYYAVSMSMWVNAVLSAFERGATDKLREEIIAIHSAAGDIIEEFEADSSIKKLLEVGCSRGYTSSYFIARGYDLLGMDISEHAISSARSAFGDHFCTLRDRRFIEGRNYDGIFHLGTIGCVEDPIGFTNGLIEKLRPGGVLVFNAPTRAPCDELSIPWVWGACPPDLVTLFPNDFWATHFSGAVTTTVTVRKFADRVNAVLRLRRLFGQRHLKRGSWRAPISAAEAKHAEKSVSIRGLRALRRKLAGPILTAVGSFLPPTTNSFGVIVRMQKRA